MLTFIRSHISAHGYPPTMREIADHMDIGSTNAVNDHLRAVERKGYIRRNPGTTRGITLADFDGGPRAAIELKLRVALARYTIVVVQGERVVTDLAAELAAAIGS